MFLVPKNINPKKTTSIQSVVPTITYNEKPYIYIGEDKWATLKIEQ
jgi:hypothetical protein